MVVVVAAASVVVGKAVVASVAAVAVVAADCRVVQPTSALPSESQHRVLLVQAPKKMHRSSSVRVLVQVQVQGQERQLQTQAQIGETSAEAPVPR